MDTKSKNKSRPLPIGVVAKIVSLLVMSIGSILLFITALMLNQLQLLNYVVFYNTNRAIQRKLNVYLQDMILFQSVIVMDWISGSRIRLFFPNQESKEMFGKEHVLAIGNHRYQLDAFFYWELSEQYRQLGATKAFAKYELRKMPIIGWMFHFGEFIFLRRSWKEDMKSIGPAIDRLFEYRFPFQLLLLPEGTRFTPEKHQASLAFAKERNISTTFKHHLLPRVKGFAQTLHHMQAYKGQFGVYNIQAICPQNNERFGPNYEPTMKNFFLCKPFNADVYLERIDDSRLPGIDATEEEHTKFLYSLFKQKDELMDAHDKHSLFPNCLMQTVKPSISRLLLFLLLNVGFSGSLLTTVIYLALYTQSFVLRCIIYGFIAIVFVGVLLVLASMRNSNYGKTTSNTKNLPNNNNNLETVYDNSGEKMDTNQNFKN